MIASMSARFHALHHADGPLVLVNIWDAGSARVVAGAGATALATSSWSVAAAHGMADGQHMSFDDVLETTSRIVRAVDIPVSVDAEAGYAEDEATMVANIARLMALGVVGINLEDSMVGTEELRAPGEQASRIAAVRRHARSMDCDLFINARTDLFLMPGGDPDAKLDDTIVRGQDYVAAGASGLFVPGLSDPAAIRRLCDAIHVPVNVMVTDPIDVPSLHALGVRRISRGPAPYRSAMATLRDQAETIYR